MFLLGVWDDTYGNDSKISRLFGIPLKIMREKSTVHFQMHITKQRNPGWQFLNKQMAFACEKGIIIIIKKRVCIKSYNKSQRDKLVLWRSLTWNSGKRGCESCTQKKVHLHKASHSLNISQKLEWVMWRRQRDRNWSFNQAKTGERPPVTAGACWILN